MTGYQLKVLACITMLIDHIGAILFPQYYILRIIGRLAFPIFAWSITIGYEHTRNVYKYMGRMGLFALISQVPFMLAFQHLHVGTNIFFTLLLGLLAIYTYERATNKLLGAGMVFVFAMAAVFLKTDYDLYGVFTIFFFYRFRQDMKGLVIAQAVLNIVPNMLSVLPYIIQGTTINLRIFTQSLSLLSLILIYFYNQTQGRKSKYVFYVFYPLHLFILYVIHQYMF